MLQHVIRLCNAADDLSPQNIAADTAAAASAAETALASMLRTSCTIIDMGSYLLSERGSRPYNADDAALPPIAGEHVRQILPEALVERAGLFPPFDPSGQVRCCLATCILCPTVRHCSNPCCTAIHMADNVWVPTCVKTTDTCTSNHVQSCNTVAARQSCNSFNFHHLLCLVVLSASTTCRGLNSAKLLLLICWLVIASAIGRASHGSCALMCYLQIRGWAMVSHITLHRYLQHHRLR